MSHPVAVICAAGPGLGRTLALHLAARGYDLVLAARTAANLALIADAVETASGRTALAITADATEPAGVERVVAAALDRFGQIDAAIHSLLPPMEVGAVVDLDEHGLHEWRDIVSGNIVSAALLARAAGRAMVRQSSGSIVFVTATSALGASPTLSSHAVAKAGIQSLARCLAAELGPSGVRVNCVAPSAMSGVTVSDGLDDPEWRDVVSAYVDGQIERAALRRLPTEQDVAEVVGFLCEPASVAITGQTLVADSGVVMR